MKKQAPPPRPKLNSEATRFVSLSDYKQLDHAKAPSSPSKLKFGVSFFIVVAVSGLVYRFLPGTKVNNVVETETQINQPYQHSSRVPASAAPAAHSAPVIYDEKPAFERPFQQQAYGSPEYAAPEVYEPTYDDSYPSEYAEPQPEHVSNDYVWEE